MAKKKVEKVKVSQKFTVGEVIELVKHGIVPSTDEARHLLGLQPLPPQV